jgi:hypothetical protein
MATRPHAIVPISKRGAFVFLVRSSAVNRRPVVATLTIAFEAARETDTFADYLARNRRVPPS